MKHNFYNKCIIHKTALLMLFISLAGCSKHENKVLTQPPLAVEIVTVKRADIKESIHYVGTVHSRNEINILARVSGKIADLPVNEGEDVKAETDLALITAPEMSARVNRTRAELLKAKEESSFLCDQAKLDGELLKKGSLSKIIVDSSMQKCRSSRAAFKAAKAGLKEIKSIAGNVVESAPFDGKVLKWLTEPGENIMPGRPILKFGDNLLEVRVNVHEKDISSGIKNDTPALLTLDNRKVILSKIYKISPMASGPGRMVEVRIPLDDNDARLIKHGMSVDVKFIVNEHKDVLTVPVNAVLETDSQKGVFVVKNRKAIFKEITSSISDEGLIEINGSVKAGDFVITGALDTVKNNMNVYPVKKEDHHL